MNKEIYDKLIDAEKVGEGKTIALLSEFFNEYQSNYKKMAELLVVIKNRLKNNVDNEEYFNIYLDFWGKITAWSNDTLSEENFNNFVELSHNYSVIIDEQN